MKQLVKNFSLKDQLLPESAVQYLASIIKRQYSDFNSNAFQEETLVGYSELELKARMAHICNSLIRHLPSNYEESVQILLDSCEKENKDSDFVFGAYCEFIQKQGCTKEHLTVSLATLGTLTSWFSAEFAIRDFINTFPDEVLAQMIAWSKDSDVHKRRLASEGTRPKLPWGIAIGTDYRLVRPILDQLHDDKDRYVVRSVANHLNDISKSDPDFVLQCLKDWGMTATDYLTTHSLRTAIKQGHVGALAFIGYKQHPKVELRQFCIQTPKVRMGNELIFSFDVVAQQDEDILIDYVITYATKTTKTSKKVFKLSQIKMKKDERKSFVKKQLFRLMSTKSLYPGKHTIEIQINGSILGSKSFEITV
ncbi:MAG: 3-methyladenine DNA glycosylase AlkC [Candidatus Woesearchaeota archaeon]|jgi:3-methyladenine DNA glycosylase AlkC